MNELVTTPGGRSVGTAHQPSPSRRRPASQPSTSAVCIVGVIYTLNGLDVADFWTVFFLVYTGFTSERSDSRVALTVVSVKSGRWLHDSSLVIVLNLATVS